MRRNRGPESEGVGEGVPPLRWVMREGGAWEVYSPVSSGRRRPLAPTARDHVVHLWDPAGGAAAGRASRAAVPRCAVRGTALRGLCGVDARSQVGPPLARALSGRGRSS